jgi:hypothetical protein
VSDDTIVGMLRGELRNVDPNEQWGHDQRQQYREHLLGMIADREQAIEDRTRRERHHALMLRMFERLMWIFGYVVLTQLGVSVPIPGLG